MFCNIYRVKLLKICNIYMVVFVFFCNIYRVVWVIQFQTGVTKVIIRFKSDTKVFGVLQYRASQRRIILHLTIEFWEVPNLPITLNHAEKVATS